MFINLPRFPNYQISPSGEVFSITSARVLKSTVCRDTGYRYIILRDAQSYRKKRTLHSLLAEVFIPNPESLPQVNHKDGDKLNNQLSNLEWVNSRDNVRHAFTNNLCSHKAGVDYTKIPQLIIQLQTNKTWTDLQQELGLSDPSTIRKLIKREFERQGRLPEFKKLSAMVHKRVIDRRSHTIELVSSVGDCRGFPSINAVARFLGVNPGTVHKALTHNKPIGAYQIRSPS